MSALTPRIAREARTIEVMIRMYCAEHHEAVRASHLQASVTGPRPHLCPECRELLNYAFERLERCPFQEGKTVCALCPVHCYRAEMRERVRTVMRWSGPRMITRHPILAVLHLLDQRRKKPLRRQPAVSRSRAISGDPA